MQIVLWINQASRLEISPQMAPALLNAGRKISAVEVTTSPVSRAVDFRKGAISASAVFIVISVAITGLAMDISVNTVVSSFQSSSEQGSINWFGETISAQALELCKSSNDDRAVPYDSSYSRQIAGLQSIEVKTESQYVGRGTQIYEKYFSLGFGDGSDRVDLETHTQYGSYECQDVTFNGTGSGDAVNGLDGSATYEYRLFSDSQGEVTIQVEEEN